MVRQEGLAKLLSSCKSSDNSSGVDYALKRLIRGLGSDRKCARIGYFASLCAILRDLPTTGSTDLIDLMIKLLPISSGDNRNDAIIGRLLCAQCLITTNAIEGADSNVRLFNALRELFTTADRRLYFAISSLMVKLIRRAVQVADQPQEVVEKVKDFLPTSFSDMTEATCSLLLSIMSIRDDDTFRSTRNSWKRTLFDKKNETNMMSFLFKQKEPLAVESFEMAFNVALNVDKFKSCWKLFIKHVGFDEQHRTRPQANHQYILLRVVQLIARMAEQDSPISDFLFSKLDLHLLVPTTDRTRAAAVATVRELARLLCRCESERYAHFSQTLLDKYIDADNSLVSAFLVSMRQNCPDKVIPMLGILCDKTDGQLRDLQVQPRQGNSKLCFLIDQICQTVKALRRPVPTPHHLSKWIISLVIRCSDTSSPSSKTLTPSTRRLVGRLAFDVIARDSQTPAESAVFQDPSKSRKLLKSVLDKNRLDDGMAAAQRTAKLFKLWEKRRVQFEGHPGFFKALNSLIWTCFVYTTLENLAMDTSDLACIVERVDLCSQTSQDWMTVLCDLMLSLTSNSSHFVHAMLLRVFKDIVPHLDLSSQDVFFSAILDTHPEDQESEDEEKGKLAGKDESSQCAQDDGEELNWQDIGEDVLPVDDSELLRQFLHSRSKAVRSKERPGTVFKSRCVDFIFLYYTPDNDAFARTLHRLTELTVKASSVVPVAVSKKIKLMLLQHTSKVITGKPSAAIKDRSSLVRSLLDCLETIIEERRTNEFARQSNVLTHTLINLGNLLHEMAGLSKQLPEECEDDVRDWAGKVAEKFIKGKPSVLRDPNLQGALRNVPYLSTAMINALIKAMLTIDKPKPFVLISSSTLIGGLLIKVPVRADDKLKPQYIDLTKYALLVLNWCLENGKQTSNVWSKLIRRLLKFNALPIEGEQMILQRLLDIKESGFDSLGKGWRNRTLTVIDSIEARHLKKRKSSLEPFIPDEETVTPESVEHTKRIKLDQNGVTEETKASKQLRLDEVVHLPQSSSDDEDEMPYGLPPFRGIGCLSKP